MSRDLLNKLEEYIGARCPYKSYICETSCDLKKAQGCINHIAGVLHHAEQQAGVANTVCPSNHHPS